MTMTWHAAWLILALPVALRAQQPALPCADSLTDIRKVDSTIRVAGAEAVLVRPDVAARLVRVSRRLATGAVGLKVLAGAGSGPHEEGWAVDLTLVDLSRGTELPMGGRYPGSDTAAAAPPPTEREARYRELLRRVMVEEGFVADSARWWHFELPGQAVSH
jgi:hypothetical protein